MASDDIDQLLHDLEQLNDSPERPPRTGGSSKSDTGTLEALLLTQSKNQVDEVHSPVCPLKKRTLRLSKDGYGSRSNSPETIGSQDQNGSESGDFISPRPESTELSYLSSSCSFTGSNTVKV
jgi:hypothetical protein